MSKRKPHGLVHGGSDMGKSSNFENLPKEIISEILSHLAPDTLMRLKCLNKSWYFVIKFLVTDPDFVAKHLNHSKSNPETLIVSVHERGLTKPPEKNPGLLPESFFRELITSVLVTRSVESGCDDVKGFDLSLFLPGDNIYRLNAYHCNGVVCVSKDFRTLTLCNPALNELELFQPRTKLSLHEYEICGLGFGSDSNATDTYKIVRLLRPMKAEVFTLGGVIDSWRELEVSIEAERYGKVGDHVYLNGKCFWLMDSVPLAVLCFDVRSEKFHRLPIPNEPYLTYYDDDVYWRLLIHNDSVCLFFYPEEYFDIWEMDILGSFGYSWRKCARMSFGPFQRFHVPLSFWKRDELLVDEGEEWYVFNIWTRNTRRLVGFDMVNYFFYCGGFVKSLVSIKRLKRA